MSDGGLLHLLIDDAVCGYGMLDNKAYRVASSISERVGKSFSEIVIACLDGSLTVQTDDGRECNEEDPSVGADMARLFYDEVVMKLKGIRV